VVDREREIDSEYVPPALTDAVTDWLSEADRVQDAVTARDSEAVSVTNPVSDVVEVLEKEADRVLE
jgi:hypothetical protein